MSKAFVLIVPLAFISATAPAMAQDPTAPKKEWFLNQDNPTLPKPGEHRPDYFFQSVMQVDAHTALSFKTTDKGKEWMNFRSADRPDPAYSLTTDGFGFQAILQKDWQYNPRDALPEDITTAQLDNKISAIVPEKNLIVADKEPFGSGYCLGKIMYSGRIGVLKKLPAGPIYANDIVAQTLYIPDSAVCFGPVSASPQILQFETPDIRALKETLLVISGFYPINCKKKEGSETDQICEFTSKGSVVSEPQSQ